MIEIKTTKSTILIVDLPEGVTNLVVRQNSEQSSLWYDKKRNISSWIDLPLSKWELLGKTFELTEEQWERVVESDHIDGLYKNYIQDEDFPVYFYELDTATESGLSLLAANQVYKENPYDNDPNLLNMYPEWLEAQSRTMPNSVILIKR